MDIFERPEIARGIFFEYLRLDDPFSLDFIERTVDGFPFLLAPLAQIEGISAPVPQQPPTKSAGGNVILKTLGGAAEAISSKAAGLAGTMQHNAANAMADAAKKVKSAGDDLRQIAEQMDRKREDLWKHLSSMNHHDAMKLLSEIMSKSQVEEDSSAQNETDVEMPRENIMNAPHGRVFRCSTSRWFGETLEAPDEIAPMMHSTMNKNVLSLVHLYLLLLLIVSFPGTQGNRTTFVVRRNAKSISLSSSESSLVKQKNEELKKSSYYPEKEKFTKNGCQHLGSPVSVTDSQSLTEAGAPKLDTRSHGRIEFKEDSQQFISRTSSRKAATQSTNSSRSAADCPPSSTKNSFSEVGSVCSLQASATDENMKKSLSYCM